MMKKIYDDDDDILIRKSQSDCDFAITQKQSEYLLFCARCSGDRDILLSNFEIIYRFSFVAFVQFRQIHTA